MATWATVTEAQGITHDQTLAQADVDFAEETILLYSERTPEDRIKTRDLFWLKRAVSWQATWQMSQPGYRERSNAKQVSQDGTRVIWADPEEALNPALYMLAPNALRALKNCSWFKTRSVRFRPSRPHRSEDNPFPWDYKSNDSHPWEPM